jgi:uncharacterized membrane protein YphA (DoxX/SURF4 family)
MEMLGRQRQPTPGGAAQAPQWPKSAVRIGFGVIWGIDAALKWKPGFVNGLQGMVSEAGAGQPSWLHGWFHFWDSAIRPHPHAWAYGIAALETLIALALILGFARKLTYLVTIVTGVGIWAVAEGFGGPYTATSTDIGTACIYAVVALALLVLSLECGPSRLSVDHLIEKRVSWWHWIAEVGAHNHPAPVAHERPALPGPNRPAALPS